MGMREEVLGPRGRLALAAALGTGVVLGAAGIVVYQVGGELEAFVVENGHCTKGFACFKYFWKALR